MDNRFVKFMSDTNLKRVPAFDRYVGGGEALAFDVCLSRSKRSNLKINLNRILVNMMGDGFVF